MTAPGRGHSDGRTTTAMEGRRRTATLTVVAAPMFAVAPVFLMSGLSTIVQADLDFDARALGLLTGAFFASSAVSTVPAGFLADRIGAQRSVRLGLVWTALSLVGIALLARSHAQLALWFILAGVSNGLVHPATNLGLLHGVSRRRQGLAFGAKQASISIATLLGGVSVPLVGLTIGWRWAFGIAAVACVLGLLGTGGIRGRVPGQVRTDGQNGRWRVHRAATLHALAGLFAASAGGALTTFFVGSTVSMGVAEATAGLLFALGSAAAASARLLAGWLSDRRSLDPARLIRPQLLLGSIGLVLLGNTGGRPGLILISTVAAFFFGWGWPGLLQLAVVRRDPDAPASATSVLQLGIYSGSVAGPVGVGAIIVQFGFRAGWTVVAASLLLSVVLVTFAGRDRRTSDEPDPGRVARSTDVGS